MNISGAAAKDKHGQKPKIQTKRRCKPCPVIPVIVSSILPHAMEAASEVGVNLKNGYNGDLTSKQAGSVGGQMVKKMVEAYENGIK